MLRLDAAILMSLRGGTGVRARASRVSTLVCAVRLSRHSVWGARHGPVLSRAGSRASRARAVPCKVQSISGVCSVDSALEDAAKTRVLCLSRSFNRTEESLKFGHLLGVCWAGIEKSSATVTYARAVCSLLILQIKATAVHSCATLSDATLLASMQDAFIQLS